VRPAAAWLERRRIVAERAEALGAPLLLAAEAGLVACGDVAARLDALAGRPQATESAAALQAAAQTSFDAAFDAYRHGVGTMTTVSLAATQLLQAQDAATQVHSGALSAAATVAFATGALGSAPADQRAMP
jgi:outer membrane protein TolC